jgi:hypothetical protein
MELIANKERIYKVITVFLFAFCFHENEGMHPLVREGERLGTKSKASPISIVQPRHGVETGRTLRSTGPIALSRQYRQVDQNAESTAKSREALLNRAATIHQGRWDAARYESLIHDLEDFDARHPDEDLIFPDVGQSTAFSPSLGIYLMLFSKRMKFSDTLTFKFYE